MAINPERLHVFTETYRVALEHAISTYPGEYGYPATDAPRVAEKMGAAFAAGSYNKDGRAIKATCRALGIKWTYTAINAYLRAAEVCTCSLGGNAATCECQDTALGQGRR